MVGLDGFEPSTSRLSGVRSDQAELQAPRSAGSGKEQAFSGPVGQVVILQNPPEPFSHQRNNLTEHGLIAQN